MRLKVLTLSCSVTLVAISGTASADLFFGASKRAGMAGAGLALPSFASINGPINPALYAFGSRNIRFSQSMFGVRLKGLSFDELRDHLSNASGGGLDEDSLGDFARRFGDDTKEFGAVGDLGFSVEGFHFDVSSEILATTIPNASLRAKIQAGDTNFTLADALDGYGYGFYTLNFGYGAKVPLNVQDPVTTPDLALGARVKVVRGYYSHHIASGAQIQNNGGSTAAVEMAASNSLSRSGVGVDLGAHVSFGEMRNSYAGLWVENAVRPRVSFDGTLPADLSLGVIGETNINPFTTQIHAGVAHVVEAQVAGRTSLALDAVDIGNRAGISELRAGVNHEFNRIFSLQVGYGTRNGFAVGIGVYGFHLAVGRDLPMTLQSAFRF